jgi:hypothetical protein
MSNTPAGVAVIERVQPATDSRTAVLEHAANELIFAVVGHVGSGTSTVADALQKLLESPGLTGGRYDAVILKARDVIQAWAEVSGRPLPMADRHNHDRPCLDLAASIA